MPEATTQRRARSLEGRTLWIPRMTYAGARLTASAFRSAGIDARVTPESDERTLELGGLHCSGQECYPEKITLGDFLRIVEADDFDPHATAFFMPTADGPCRFGQYAPYLKLVLKELGHEDVPVITPTSANSYDGLAEQAPDMVRRVWRGIVAGDILHKMLLRVRPYETQPGTADATFERALDLMEEAIEQPGLKPRDRLPAMIDGLTRGRDLYRAVPARYTRDRPLIGIVGEIFCRLNTFSNENSVRKIEAQGGEAWLSEMAEWVLYTNWSHMDNLRRRGRRISLEMLGAVIKDKVQHADEHKLMAPFAEDFRGYEEPHDVYEEVLKPGWPYLPANGALGEMAISVGRTIYLHHKGVDGVVDISPFSCMNGIVSEAVYHAVSRDFDQLPIRTFYFDATASTMERDLDIFMELARAYRRTKRTERRYPACFQTGPAPESVL